MPSNDMFMFNSTDIELQATATTERTTVIVDHIKNISFLTQ